MNNQQRKQIEELVERLQEIGAAVEELASGEQDKFDNMPESLQGSERGQACETAAQNLQEAADGFADIISSLEAAAK